MVILDLGNPPDSRPTFGDKLLRAAGLASRRRRAASRSRPATARRFSRPGGRPTGLVERRVSDPGDDDRLDLRGPAPAGNKPEAGRQRARAPSPARPTDAGHAAEVPGCAEEDLRELRCREGRQSQDLPRGPRRYVPGGRLIPRARKNRPADSRSGYMTMMRLARVYPLRSMASAPYENCLLVDTLMSEAGQ